MLRFLLFALPLTVCVVAGAYMVALLTPETAPQPVVIAEVPEPAVVQDQATPPDAASRPDPGPEFTTSAVARPASELQREFRNVTPPGVHSGAIRAYEDRQREPEPAAEPERRRYPRVVVETAGTLRARDRTIRIAGIEAPGLDAQCRDAGGQAWPCGRAAASALQRFVRQRTVECEAAEESGDDTRAHCSVGGTPIAEWLVRQGWAQPAGDGVLADIAEEARRGGRGLHRDQWRPDAGPVAVPEPFRAPDALQAAQPAPALY